jgi:two-component system cell cycle sensor histidine kinase/response regulator CckA
MNFTQLHERRMKPPVRILHLEDNPKDAELVRSMLESAGLTCEVVLVETREAFLAALERKEFDLILSDFTLPAFDGLAALTIAQEKCPDIPYIFASGTLGEESAVLTLQCGATDYVLKQRLARLPSVVCRALRDAEEKAQRRRVEQALQESEARLRLIAENSEDIFWMMDVELTKILYISPAYEKIWGRSCQSLREAPKSFLSAVHPEDRTRVTNALREQQATGQLDEEYRIIRPDGSVRWIWDRGFPIRDDQGRIGQLAGFARDITDRKQLEEQYRQAQKLEGIGQLAGGIAHDFNNLLTVINGYSDLTMESLPPNHPLRAQLEQIREAGKRAASLTQQILAFSRKQKLDPIVFNLNQAVASMDKLLRRLIGEHIILVTTANPALGRIKADQGQIEQVIMNLAVNARDAMPNGGTMTIETSNVDLDDAFVRTHPSIQPGPYVKLSVRDSGCGMDAATQARIFEPFFTTKKQGEGTGLGLATAYGIVTQSGGTMEVVSDVGKGSEFRVYLPRVPGETESMGHATVSLGSPRGTETVLLVEDEDIVRSLTRQVLRGQGYAVLDVRQAVKAQEICEKYTRPIHLLLTDLVMPGMNGRELAERLLSVRPEMKVLYMSGYENGVLGQQGKLPAGTAFIHKPFTLDSLARKVREVLDTPSSCPSH